MNKCLAKLFLVALVPSGLYSLSPEQFTQETRKAFENKYVRFNNMIAREKISQMGGLPAIFKDLEGLTFEQAWDDPEIVAVAEKCYSRIKNDEQCLKLIQAVQNAAEDDLDQAKYNFMKHVQLQVIQNLLEGCVGMEFPQENSTGPKDIDWMKVDNPEWARLNANKQFAGQCRQTLVGVNLALSLFAQEASVIVKG